jgi:hypothetical protein
LEREVFVADYSGNFDSKNKGTFDLSNPNDLDAAEAIIGTRNGIAAPYWLKDYTQAFGTQKIMEVHVWDGVPGGSNFNSDATWGMAFELGPA